MWLSVSVCVMQNVWVNGREWVMEHIGWYLTNCKDVYMQVTEMFVLFVINMSNEETRLPAPCVILNLNRCVNVYVCVDQFTCCG